jgi:transcriptional regulator with XRE-family HTH domain
LVTHLRECLARPDPGYLSGMAKITRESCRAARALLGWTREQLAAEAEVNFGTVKFFEMGKRNPTRATLGALERALEAAGVEFIAEDGAGAGVRLKQPKGGTSNQSG